MCYNWYIKEDFFNKLSKFQRSRIRQSIRH
nr:MAG TPA: neurotoxin [Caudoviricetes sp.]DAP70022.1 MAG TPA: neurotoxin [Caudoviricetes sp.]